MPLVSESGWKKVGEDLFLFSLTLTKGRAVEDVSHLFSCDLCNGMSTDHVGETLFCMERMISRPAPKMTMIREAAWVCTDIRLEGSNREGIVELFPATGIGYFKQQAIDDEQGKAVDVFFKRQIMERVDWRGDYLVICESFESVEAQYLPVGMVTTDKITRFLAVLVVKGEGGIEDVPDT